MEQVYTGKMQPLDAAEWAAITLTAAANGAIAAATFECADDPLLRDCCKALCGVLADKPLYDVMQMNNNAVYYNVEHDLPRDRLYLASIAVQAAKKAALAYLNANGVPYEGEGLCDCLK
ncbi:MAG: hypothetical protein IJK89_08765 [Clostridia bacterium]|nr:hypothetical protein [Clostridia bacterium]